MARALFAFLFSTSAFAVVYPLAWEKPVPQDDRITGYELQWGAESGIYTSAASVAGYDSEAGSFDIPEGVHHAALRAVGLESDGATTIYSPFSNEIELTIENPVLLTNLYLIFGPSAPVTLPAPAIAYSFEGTDPDVAVDSKGLWPDGAAVNADSVPGKSGQARDFNGTDSVVQIGAPDLPSGSAMTIAVWMKADDFGIYDARLVSKAVGTADQDHYWMLSTFSGNTVRFRLKAGGYAATLIGDADVVTPGQWHHVAATYDGARMALYVDSVEVGSIAKSGAIDTDPTVPVSIGNQPQGARAFDGLIDEFRVYAAALSPEQLALDAQTSVNE